MSTQNRATIAEPKTARRRVGTWVRTPIERTKIASRTSAPTSALRLCVRGRATTNASVRSHPRRALRSERAIERERRQDDERVSEHLAADCGGPTEVDAVERQEQTAEDGRELGVRTSPTELLTDTPHEHEDDERRNRSDGGDEELRDVKRGHAGRLAHRGQIRGEDELVGVDELRRCGEMARSPRAVGERGEVKAVDVVRKRRPVERERPHPDADQEDGQCGENGASPRTTPSAVTHSNHHRVPRSGSPSPHSPRGANPVAF